MTIDSLVEMSQRACMKYSRGITDIGHAPYDLLRPILLKIQTPEQLHNLETNSPQIIGKDAEIWLGMIERDIPNYASKPHQPSDPKNWYRVYRKLKKEAEQEMAAGDDKLKAALNNIQQKRQAQAAIIMPRNQLPNSPTKRRPSNYTRTRGTNHLTVMERIKKEARGSGSSRMNKPMHELQMRSSVVKKAPESFVRDIRQQNLTKLPIQAAREAMGQKTVRPPRQPTRQPQGGPSPSYDLTQDREARLRALKLGKQPASRPSSSGSDSATNNLTLDFLEDDDDIFGDKPTSQSSPVKIGMGQVKPQQKRKRSNGDLFIAGRKRPKSSSPGL